MGIRFIEEPGDGTGAGYVPPASQEEYNRTIQDRVARAEASTRAKVEAEYAKYTGVDVEALKRDAAELAQIRQQTPGEPVQRPEDAKTISDLQLTLDRYAVAAANDIPLAHAPRLIGATRDELDADAKEYRNSLRGRGYVPGQGANDGAPLEGAQGIAEAERRFGKTT